MTEIDIKFDRLLIAHELAVRLEVDLGHVPRNTPAWQRQSERAVKAREKFETKLEAFKARLGAITRGE